MNSTHQANDSGNLAATHSTPHMEEDTMPDYKADLRRDLAAIVADAEELLRHTVHAAGTPAAAARERLQTTLSNARTRTLSGLSNLRDHGVKAVGAADTYVRARTWQSVGVAALAGLTVGLLLTRRKGPSAE